MTEVASGDPARHQSGGLAVALARLNLDALTVADAVADVASMAGENVTTAIRADLKELRADFNELRAGVNARIDTLTSETNARFADTNARIDTLASETNARFHETNARIGETNARIGETNARIDALVGSVQSLQREISTLRWMIGVGFTLLSVFLALSTFLRGSPPVP